MVVKMYRSMGLSFENALLIVAMAAILIIFIFNDKGDML